ncbi:MAG: hypothetical protein D6698_15020 [Gammaproteobacteria bacterium]|nr:MAG: hypothetical protein D6698_15020 [Gammaproteobacteria bacterium]
MARIAKKTDLGESGVAIAFGEEGAAGKLTADLSEVSDDIRLKLALHGLKQKLGDSYAGEKDPAAAFKAASEVWERLKAGEWSSARSGSGGRVGQLAQALARATGVSLEEAIAKVESLSKEERAELRKHPRVQKALLEIKMEALGDTDADLPI